MPRRLPGRFVHFGKTPYLALNREATEGAQYLISTPVGINRLLT